MSSPFLAVHLAIALATHGPSPETTPATDEEGSAEVAPTPAGEREMPPAPQPPPADAEPSEPVAAPSEAEPAEASTPPVEDDPDAPVLRGEPSRAPDGSELDEVTQRRATRRGTVAGLLVGMGATLGLAAPIFMLRPSKAFVVGALSDGTGIAIVPNGGPLAAGFVTAFVGGTLTFLGGYMLSDGAVEPARAARRQRGLHVASGIALGLACGAFLAGAMDGARAGTQWQQVLDRAAGPEDAVDGGEAADKASRSMAFFAAVPPLLGLGLGLRTGKGARARVVPTLSGAAVVGRF